MRGILFATLIVVPAVRGEDPPKAKPPEVKDGWTILFDGKTLGHWKSTEFVNGGAVDVKDGAIANRRGQPMTGVVYKGPKLPTIDYEILLGSQADGRPRLFLCTDVSRQGDRLAASSSPGGAETSPGLSSLNGSDASENPTTTSVKIENDRWYKMRVRTTAKKIEAWVDDEKVVEIDPSEYSILRPHRSRSMPTVRIRVVSVRPG